MSLHSAEENAARGTRFEELLQRYGVLLHRVVVRMCPRDLRASCDDIEQEAKIALWKALSPEREIPFPASYIYKVALSVTMRAIQRARNRREDPLETEGDSESGPLRVLPAARAASPDRVAEGHEVVRAVKLALAQLPKNRRLAVQLNLQGFTTREIGDLLGWSEPKARNLVYRGLTDLQSSLRVVGIEYQP